MIWFVESPWPALTLGIGLEIILAIFLVRTGRAIMIAAMVGVLALTVASIVIERMVVTDFEAVEDSLDAVARALESGDAKAVMASFTSNCPRRGEVENALARFTIREAHVGGDLEVRLNRLTLPPSATAYFTGRVEGKDKRGVVPYEHMIRKFKVVLHKQGERWLIADYSDTDFRDRGER